MWNYRVMLKDGQLAVHEVFYDDEGRINNWSVEPVFPRGDEIEDLVSEFERYQRALTEPVLDYAALEVESECRRK
ncbi:MAG: hypothetical protein C0467_02570 [Planctomycetaceae bacterium]|nr:hypothetical protein [Planctomycetaceae bacterium]